MLENSEKDSSTCIMVIVSDAGLFSCAHLAHVCGDLYHDYGEPVDFHWCGYHINYD